MMCEEDPVILTSPSDDIVQDGPVTTTYPVDRGTTRRPARRRHLSSVPSQPPGPTAADPRWDRVERLYAFCRARAQERIEHAEQHRAAWKAVEEHRELEVVEAMYAQAVSRGDIVLACAVTYLRTKAMRDADHPAFLGEWLTPGR
jgi:hypothetical protein